MRAHLGPQNAVRRPQCGVGALERRVRVAHVVDDGELRDDILYNVGAVEAVCLTSRVSDDSHAPIARLTLAVGAKDPLLAHNEGGRLFAPALDGGNARAEALADAADHVRELALDALDPANLGPGVEVERGHADPDTTDASQAGLVDVGGVRFREQRLLVLAAEQVDDVHRVVGVEQGLEVAGEGGERGLERAGDGDLEAKGLETDFLPEDCGVVVELVARNVGRSKGGGNTRGTEPRTCTNEKTMDEVRKIVSV